METKKLFPEFSDEYEKWRNYQELLEGLREQDRDSEETPEVFSIGSDLFFRDRYCDHINQMNNMFKEIEICKIMGNEKNEKRKTAI